MLYYINTTIFNVSISKSLLASMQEICSLNTSVSFIKQFDGQRADANLEFSRMVARPRIYCNCGKLSFIWKHKNPLPRLLTPSFIISSFMPKTTCRLMWTYTNFIRNCTRMCTSGSIFHYFIYNHSLIPYPVSFIQLQ